MKLTQSIIKVTNYKNISGNDIEPYAWCYCVASDYRQFTIYTSCQLVRLEFIGRYEISRVLWMAIKLNVKWWTVVSIADIDFTRLSLCYRQRDELQRQREGSLRGGWCVSLWHPEGGAGPGPPGPGSQAEFLEESTSGSVPADGQQVGYEALRQQEGAYEGTNQAKSRRSLGHPSLLQFSVSPLPISWSHSTGINISRYRIRSGWKTRPTKKYRFQVQPHI